MNRLLGRIGAAVVLLTVGAMASAECRNDIPATAPDEHFRENGDGTVTDVTTGLMWKQCAEGLSGADCSTGAADTFTWQGALQRGTDAELAGFSDWRLPNKNELASLVEQRCYYPATNISIFPNTPSSAFWSSSPGPSLPDGAWAVYFTDGNVDYDPRYPAYHVRLVRGGGQPVDAPPVLVAFFDNWALFPAYSFHTDTEYDVVTHGFLYVANSTESLSEVSFRYAYAPFTDIGEVTQLRLYVYELTGTSTRGNLITWADTSVETDGYSDQVDFVFNDSPTLKAGSNYRFVLWAEDGAGFSVSAGCGSGYEDPVIQATTGEYDSDDWEIAGFSGGYCPTNPQPIVRLYGTR